MKATQSMWLASVTVAALLFNNQQASAQQFLPETKASREVNGFSGISPDPFLKDATSGTAGQVTDLRVKSGNRLALKAGTYKIVTTSGTLVRYTGGCVTTEGLNRGIYLIVNAKDPEAQPIRVQVD